MINKLTVGVTTVSFSGNRKLIQKLENMGFAKVILNPVGRRLTHEELIEFLQGCDIAIIGLDKITASVLKDTPRLKAIAKYGVGLDNINFKDCADYGVQVMHTQGVNKRSVAEMALGFMLSLCRNLYTSSNLLKDGTWHKDGGIQLTGKTVGIIGVGNIGKELVKLIKPFGCRLLVNDIIDQKDYYKENNLIETSKKQIFEEADIITIHTPHTALTKNMINKDVFRMMKPTAFVINTARGGIIDEQDLREALINNMIAGAALDAYVKEPPVDSVLVQLPNLICTPHIGGNAEEAVAAMGQAAIDNVFNYASSLK